MTPESQAALAKLAADTKTACATSADITKAANAAHTTKPAAKGLAYHAKSAVLVHSVYLAAAGGFIAGIIACHLAKKYWLNKDNTVEQVASD